MADYIGTHDFSNATVEGVWWPSESTQSEFTAGENLTVGQPFYVSNGAWSRTAWRIYLSSLDNSTYTDCDKIDWYVNDTVTTWNTVKGNTSWVDDNQTFDSWEIWELQYLSWLEYWIDDVTTIWSWNISWAINWIFLKANWLAIYISIWSDIYQHNISTAWDITTVSSSATNSTNVGGGYNIFFNPTWTKMYTIGAASSYLYEYPLSTARNITTKGTASTKDMLESNMRWVYLSPDWLKLYTLSYTKKIRSWSLSTAWTLSTATLVDTKQVTYWTENIYLSNDWLRAFTTSANASGDQYIYQYDMSTPRDISTAVYTKSSISFGNSNSYQTLAFTFWEDWYSLYTANQEWTVLKSSALTFEDWYIWPQATSKDIKAGRCLSTTELLINPGGWF